MTTSIFDNLLSLASLHHNSDSELISSMKMIARHMKISVPWDNIEHLSRLSLNTLEKYETNIGIIFHPLTPASLDNLPSPEYPILIEEKNNGNISVFIKKTGKKYILFNPLSNKKEHVNLNANIFIHRAWQCIPSDCPATSGYMGLVKFTLKYFNKKFYKSYF